MRIISLIDMTIHNIANEFLKLVKAQTVKYDDSVKDILNKKFQERITNEVFIILQSISDKIFEETKEGFGHFDVNAKAKIDKKTASLYFEVSSELKVNEENNKLFVNQLNKILPIKFNKAMTETVKNIEGVSYDLVLDLNLFEITGDV